ncbi:uncharacterized protein LOC130793026 [Actinidia eriantha]|uniref:uncharacterized protein LOC130793026 n=1 Tax=Actinidia eriantha TaxID=165200 RepID=UPI0025865F87|nr:uncharacterized protein LOC130793026 [Actinidia eriantha]
MAAIMKILCLVLFLVLLSKGNAQCKPSDLAIRQKRTGKEVNNKPEWKVEVANACPCTQLNVKLLCTGFKTVEKVDPAVITITGNLCSINEAIYSDSSINFTYASDSQFPFKVANSQQACS